MKETWKDIAGYEGLYQISNTGRVKSMAKTVRCKNGATNSYRERVMAKSKKPSGEVKITLSKGGKSKTLLVHRLVAIHFIPNPMNKPEVNHIDGVRDNNVVSNLEWVTSSENQQHAYRIGLQEGRKGSAHHMARLTEPDVEKIRQMYASGKLLQREIANMYGVRENLVSRIVNRKIWRHVG